MFKSGDVISPVTPESFPAWVDMTVLSYSEVSRDASVQLSSGNIIHGFNLDSSSGVEFKVNKSEG